MTSYFITDIHIYIKTRKSEIYSNICVADNYITVKLMVTNSP